MVRAIVGGRAFQSDMESVLRTMKGAAPEPIREHFVDVGGVTYPPKQVLACVTGWERTSFTTMEAQRVLTRLGFSCRRVSTGTSPSDAMEPVAGDATIEHRVKRAENAIGVLTEAVASILGRIEALEGR